MRDHKSPPPSPPQILAGDGAVLALLGLLAAGAMTPNRDILNLLNTKEIVLIRRQERSWTLPRDCKEVGPRMREVEAFEALETAEQERQMRNNSSRGERHLDELLHGKPVDDAAARPDADGTPVQSHDQWLAARHARLAEITKHTGGEIPPIDSRETRSTVGKAPPPPEPTPLPTLAGVKTESKPAATATVKENEMTSDATETPATRSKFGRVPRRVKNRRTGTVYPSAWDAGKAVGLSEQSIQAKCRDGALWTYTDDPVTGTVTASAGAPASDGASGDNAPTDVADVPPHVPDAKPVVASTKGVSPLRQVRHVPSGSVYDDARAAAVAHDTTEQRVFASIAQGGRFSYLSDAPNEWSAATKPELAADEPSPPSPISLTANTPRAPEPAVPVIPSAVTSEDPDVAGEPAVEDVPALTPTVPVIIPPATPINGHPQRPDSSVVSEVLTAREQADVSARAKSSLIGGSFGATHLFARAVQGVVRAGGSIEPTDTARILAWAERQAAARLTADTLLNDSSARAMLDGDEVRLVAAAAGGER